MAPGRASTTVFAAGRGMERFSGCWIVCNCAWMTWAGLTGKRGAPTAATFAPPVPQRGPKRGLGNSPRALARRLGIENPFADRRAGIAFSRRAQRRQPTRVLLSGRTSLGWLSWPLASLATGRSRLQRATDTTVAGKTWDSSCHPLSQGRNQTKTLSARTGSGALPDAKCYRTHNRKAQTVPLHCHTL
jgi:hypothetical protein